MLIALSLLVGPATAGAFIGPDLENPGPGFSLLPPGDRLAFEEPAPTPAPEPAVSEPPERKPNWVLTSLIAGGAVTGAALNAVLEGGTGSYHVGHEGWFGPNAHFGGADKGAHFVDYYIVSKEISKVFVMLGHTPERARWLSAGLASVTGLVNEIGDGTTRYGFSYEDLVMDVGGALSAALIDLAGVEDLVGFRKGTTDFENCCNFSNQIYTADLRLAGGARRLGIDIGPLKYLLLSLTYGVKGYPGNPSDPGTQRQVGFEVGLDFKQMLDDLNVRRNTWWGYGLHVAFDNIRMPFTAVGYRYDMNHGRWHGPNAGN